MTDLNEDSFLLKIIARNSSVFEGQVDFVLVPGLKGDIGILKGHAPLVSFLRQGVIEVQFVCESKSFSIRSGFLSICDELVCILVDHSMEELSSAS